MVGVLEADLADGHADVYRPLAFPFADKAIEFAVRGEVERVAILSAVDWAGFRVS
jgi:hypothetical protein